MKILAIQFRYLGDAVLLTPALRALKEQVPACQLHVLVAEEVAPLLRHSPVIDRLWAFPRRRGRADLKKVWPFVRALRRERFERCVDFGGNDRGALLSLISAARERLGPLRGRGFLGRRFCYTARSASVKGEHEIAANFRILQKWEIIPPAQPATEVYADTQLEPEAQALLSGGQILCHLATSQPRKDWPLESWLRLAQELTSAGHQVAVSSGVNDRERALAEAFTTRASSTIQVLPAIKDLALFLAVLKRARLFVSGDTGPLHFATALGVPTIGLFGPSSPDKWGAAGPAHVAVRGGACNCFDTAVCTSATPCMAAINVASVRAAVERLLH
jgi:heptosyltransferase III